MNKIVTRAKKLHSFYDRYSRFISAVSFLTGFTIDFMATRRIDAMADNLKLLSYVVLAGILIVVYHLCDNRRIRAQWLVKKTELVKTGVDFFIGGLFSSHVIFYFKSSAGFKSALFIAILFVLLIINQFFRKQSSRLYLRFGMFALASFSFFVFFLPVLTNEMNRKNFLAGVVISAAYTLLIIAASILTRGKEDDKPFFRLSGMVTVVYALLVIFYFLNWIPPLPLALKHAGIYHHVGKSDYFYNLTYEQSSVWHVWQTSDAVYHYQPGDTVFCFAAVFAPTAMKKRIFHRWKHYDEASGEWMFMEKLSYDLIGGRDGGYRGFTYKTSMTEGRWKIDIITEEEILIGSVEFLLKRVRDAGQRKMITIQR